MDRQFRWVAIVSAMLVAAVVGYSRITPGSRTESRSARHWPVRGGLYRYWAYRPWGWGFGFGPVFFLLFFWLVMFRIFAWGGFRRRGWYARGAYDIPRDFDDWHRRAHEAMNKPS